MPSEHSPLDTRGEDSSTLQHPNQVELFSLARLASGLQGQIVKISSASPELRSRLYALGLVPGATVTKLRIAPFGDPLQVRIGGSSISIRAREAQKIFLTHCD